ncbi:MAG: DJ-1/PfpI family protein [Phaeodactylibacter sp.]|nr:DJ-1/PfpI family protein [Phaeodactylibacter sp.]
MKPHLAIPAFFVLFTTLFASPAQSQPLQRGLQLNVALFVPNGAELLDFAGPGEVFSNADFNTYVIGFTDQPFISQGFMKVVPNYSYKDCPKPDVLVIPGGGGNQFYQDPEVIEWVKTQCEHALLLTVCTGALVAARGRMLDSLKVTTHYSGYSALERSCQGCEVLRDARFVDNDRIITTSGISAGIDGALHLVARIKGQKAAEEVAHYMMYDKWAPDAGLTAMEAPFLAYARKHGLAAAQEHFAATLRAGKKPYPGELSMLAGEYAGKNDYATAESILQFCLELYPYEQPMYEELGALYKAQGKYAPPTQEAFIGLLIDGEVDEALGIFEKVKKAYPSWVLFRESAANWAGYALLNRQHTEDAISVFAMNTRAYPDSFNVYDSLAEAHLRAGHKEEAHRYYEKSLELNPGNKNAKEALAELEGK